MMTKKDFVALADLIKVRRWKERDGAGLFIQDLADFLEGQNPRFLRHRWLDYVQGFCGPNGGAVRNRDACGHTVCWEAARDEGTGRPVRCIDKG